MKKPQHSISKKLVTLLLIFLTFPIAIFTNRPGTLYVDSINITGGVSSQDPASTLTPTLTPTLGTTHAAGPIKTVFMIVLENNDWSTIKGNPSAPYINTTLLPQASFATRYFNPPGNHPSEPNYLWLEAGTNLGVTTDNPPSANHQQTTAHLVTLLQHAGFSWKAYEEGINGKVCPLVDSYPYVARHNPMIFFDDVTGTNNPNAEYCIVHERPYAELATDLQYDTVANYNFITPDLCDDMHDSCGPTNDAIKQGDSWLAHAVPQIVNSHAYKNGGALFITWDEGENGSDGPLGMLVLSPYAKGKGYTNSLPHTHSSTLKTIQEIFHLTPLLGNTAKATDLRDLFLPIVFATPHLSRQSPSPKLTWPPPRLNNPQKINLTTMPQSLNLDATKDYILKFPSTPIVARFNDYAVLHISGGHNIVMIGGEIHIPDLPDTLNAIQGNDNQRQAIRLDSNTGTVFMEGLEVSGTCMDFIDISSPQARVIFQNVRVEGCRSHFESLSGGYTDEHPDLIQAWGGAKEIDIDGFTGFSDYQGFQLDSNLGVVGNIVIKHANIGRIASVPQYGRLFMWQDCNTSLFPDCATNPYAPEFPHWDLTDDTFYIQPADKRSLDYAVWPAANGIDPRKAVLAADGLSVSWPNYTAKINGRVRLGPPPGGDFVPAESVGIGYVSQGYQS
jgi:phosphatidylinositol-3-phosphatase